MTVQTATLKMLEAVNAIVTKARKLHGGIPETVVVLGASGATRSGQKHGHYAPRSWGSRSLAEGHGGNSDAGSETSREVYGEILLAGESLERGAVGTLGTILHELVHAYCDANDIKDTSNGQRYHNTKFKDVAEEFGLSIDKGETVGWSITTVPETTQLQYAEELLALDNSINVHRLGYMDLEALGIKEKPAKAKQRKMQCPKCQEPLLVTKKWWGKQGNGGWDDDDYIEEGAGLICSEHELEYEMFSEGGDND